MNKNKRLGESMRKNIIVFGVVMGFMVCILGMSKPPDEKIVPEGSPITVVPGAGEDIGLKVQDHNETVSIGVSAIDEERPQLRVRKDNETYKISLVDKNSPQATNVLIKVADDDIRAFGKIFQGCTPANIMYAQDAVSERITGLKYGDYFCPVNYAAVAMNDSPTNLPAASINIACCPLPYDDILVGEPIYHPMTSNYTAKQCAANQIIVGVRRSSGSYNDSLICQAIDTTKYILDNRNSAVSCYSGGGSGHGENNYCYNAPAALSEGDYCFAQPYGTFIYYKYGVRCTGIKSKRLYKRNDDGSQGTEVRVLFGE